jgi:hypothetical protein
MQGQARLIAFLESIVDMDRLNALSTDGAYRLLGHARENVPRETGELEDEIVVLDKYQNGGVVEKGVGVPDSSPAIHKAWATEFGTWNYGVGTPEVPKLDWPAKSKSTAMMPWLSTAVRQTREEFLDSVRAGLAAAIIPTAAGLAGGSVQPPPAPPTPPPVAAAPDDKKKRHPHDPSDRGTEP